MFNFKDLLSTRPTAPSVAEAVNNEPDNKNADDLDLDNRFVDPELEDFGGHTDRTMAKTRSKTTSSADNSRAHYRDFVASSSARKRSKVALPIDDEDFMGGKYAGVKASRQELGMDAPEEKIDSESEIEDDMEEVDDRFEFVNNASEGEDSEDDAVAAQMKALKESEKMQMEMVAKKMTSDQERGQHVRSQLKKWQSALNLRVRLQPVLRQVTRIPKPAVWNALVPCASDEVKVISEGLDEINTVIKSALCHEAQISETLNDTEIVLRKYDSVMSPKWKESLESWHQRAALGADLKANAKKQMKVINQSLWSQVEAALRDRDRLVQRTRLNRSRVQPIACDVVPEQVDFDDEDFFSVLVREWVDTSSGAQDIALAHGLVIKNIKSSSKHPVDGRASKGRKIRYDVHEKLVNYMVPVKDVSLWDDEKTDAFFASIFPETSVPIASLN